MAFAIVAIVFVGIIVYLYEGYTKTRQRSGHMVSDTEEWVVMFAIIFGLMFLIVCGIIWAASQNN